MVPLFVSSGTCGWFTTEAYLNHHTFVLSLVDFLKDFYTAPHLSWGSKLSSFVSAEGIQMHPWMILELCPTSQAIQGPQVVGNSDQSDSEAA